MTTQNSHAPAHRQPTKEQIRSWLQERRRQAGPPPSLDQVRRELGWQPTTPKS